MPSYFTIPWSTYHSDFWEHVNTIKRGKYPAPFIAVWPRDRGKSTNGEAATVDLTGRRERKYVVIVRETQDQADQSIMNIQALIESSQVREYYPHLAQVRRNREGHSLGWRRERLTTTSGVTIEGIGFDTAKRGARELEQRPDMIIFDDIDNRLDSRRTTEKKLQTFTDTLIPMGSKDCAYLFLQNVIIPHGICARLAGVSNQPTDALIDRIVSGPHVDVINPVLEDRATTHGVTRRVITGGELTWPELGLEGVQRTIDKMGFDAWQRECQQQVGDSPDALWDREVIERNRVDAAPALSELVVAVDPPSSTGQAGIITAGSTWDGPVKHGYTLADVTTPRGVKPHVWAAAVVREYQRVQSLYPGAHIRVIGEVNHGGDMIENAIRNVEGGENIRYETVRATKGKWVRAEPISIVANEGRDHHVGELTELENELCSWTPGSQTRGEESPNRLDAKVWALTALGLAPTLQTFGGIVVNENGIQP